MDTHKDSIPKQIERYTLVKRLGTGATATVYAAVYRGWNGFRLPVAIKIAKPGYEQRIWEEAHLMVQFNHPNIVDILDAGHSGVHAYYVMERVDGVNLRDLIRKSDQLPLSVGLDIAIQLCDALRLLHSDASEAIVHGDLKPANIMVNGEGQVKLLDFGIASPTGTQASDSRIGTPAYMAPEQVHGMGIDHRADIFMLGAVLYELFSGQRLFRGANVAELIRNRLRVDAILDLFQITAQVGSRCPVLPSIIHRCVRGNPAERYRRVETIGKALAEIRSDLPQAVSVSKFWSHYSGRSERVEAANVQSFPTLCPLAV